MLKTFVQIPLLFHSTFGSPSLQKRPAQIKSAFGNSYPKALFDVILVVLQI